MRSLHKFKLYVFTIRFQMHLFLFCVTSLVHSKGKNRQTCVRKSLICAFAMAFIISVMLIAANQMLRKGMD